MLVSTVQRCGATLGVDSPKPRHWRVGGSRQYRGLIRAAEATA